MTGQNQCAKYTGSNYKTEMGRKRGRGKEKKIEGKERAGRRRG